MKNVDRRVAWIGAVVLVAAGVAAAQEAASAGPRITLDEMKKLQAAGKVVVVDVRPLDQYRAGHIPGSLSIPLPNVAERVAEVKGARKVVTYCA